MIEKRAPFSYSIYNHLIEHCALTKVPNRFQQQISKAGLFLTE